jgi:ATP-dependent DNA ligase
MLMRTPTRWTKPTRRAPPGFILPAQPVLALKAPIGPGWLFAVKHDGFRIVARKEGDDVHLWSRNGRDWCAEFSGITTALKAWKLKSFVLDGEACACDDSGWPDFNALLGGGKACADACYWPPIFWTRTCAWRLAGSFVAQPMMRVVRPSVRVAI